MTKKATPVSVRLMGDEMCIKAIVSLLEERFNCKGISHPYPNRGGDGVRVYLTIHPQEKSD